MLISVLALLFCLVRLVQPILHRRPHPYGRISGPKRIAYQRRKPEWVRQQIIRLNALLSEAGTCRAVAEIFNRRFAHKKKMTVGKTFVSEVLRKSRYEIGIVRRQIKNARPRLVPKNLV
jgi:hypothetical protein